MLGKSHLFEDAVAELQVLVVTSRLHVSQSSASTNTGSSQSNVAAQESESFSAVAATTDGIDEAVCRLLVLFSEAPSDLIKLRRMTKGLRLAEKASPRHFSERLGLFSAEFWLLDKQLNKLSFILEEFKHLRPVVVTMDVFQALVGKVTRLSRMEHLPIEEGASLQRTFRILLIVAQGNMVINQDLTDQLADGLVTVVMRQNAICLETATLAGTCLVVYSMRHVDGTTSTQDSWADQTRAIAIALSLYYGLSHNDANARSDVPFKEAKDFCLSTFAGEDCMREQSPRSSCSPSSSSPSTSYSFYQLVILFSLLKVAPDEFLCSAMGKEPAEQPHSSASCSTPKTSLFSSSSTQPKSPEFNSGVSACADSGSVTQSFSFVSLLHNQVLVRIYWALSDIIKQGVHTFLACHAVAIWFKRATAARQEVTMKIPKSSVASASHSSSSSEPAERSCETETCGPENNESSGDGSSAGIGRLCKLHLLPSEPLVLDAREIIFCFCDSPEEGASEHILSGLEDLMALTKRVERQGLIGEKESPFAEDLLRHLCSLSWGVKAKLRLYRCVFQHLHPDKIFHQDSRLLEGLLSCLDLNYLAAWATKTYTTLMSSLSACEGPDSSSGVLSPPVGLTTRVAGSPSAVVPSLHGERLWVKYCLKPLCDSLRSQSSTPGKRIILLRQLLPVTLTTFPSVLPKIQTAMSDCVVRDGVSARGADGQFTDVQSMDEPGTGNLRPRVQSSDAQSSEVVDKCVLSDNVLAVRVAIARCGVELGLCELDEHLLRTALESSSNETRLEAFTTICRVTKKPEPIKCLEMKLLRDYLPFNMNVDQAAFRQRLTVLIRDLLVRAKASASTQSRWKDEAYTGNVLDFISWLLEVASGSLFCGASYQRLDTGLYLLAAIGKVTDKSHSLTKGTLTKGEVSWYGRIEEHGLSTWSHDLFWRLIGCVLGGTNDVQAKATRLLCQMGDWKISPLESKELLELGWSVVCEPQYGRIEAGAALLVVMFNRLVVAEGHVLDIGGVLNPVVTLHQPACETVANKRDSAIISFIRQLLNKVSSLVPASKSDFLQTAKGCSAHGLLLCVRKCLLDSRLLMSLQCVAERRALVGEIVVVCTDLTECALSLLGSHSDCPETTPSFEEMNEALLIHLPDTLRQEETTSNELLLLLAWCWQAMKECSILCGELVSNIGPTQLTDEIGIDRLHQLSAMFTAALTRCRHRGAIEGSSIGFVQFCSVLLRSSDPSVFSLPSGVLKNAVFSRLLRGDDSSSVTRRAAGLALLVQGVLQAEHNAGQKSLVSPTIHKLLDIASQPLPTTRATADGTSPSVGDSPADDGLFDLPQGHALHILKAMVHDAQIAPEIRPHLADITIAAVDAFDSSSWAVRNAGTQLFASCHGRLIGQKHTSQDNESTLRCTTSVAEFFTFYPSLVAYTVDALQTTSDKASVTAPDFRQSSAALEETVHSQEVSRQTESSSSALTPKTFPLLSVLSRLTPSEGLDSKYDQLTHRLLLSLRSIVSSPIMAVRILAAASLSALIPRNRLSSLLQDVIDEAFDNKQTTNGRHGYCLALVLLLRRVVDEQNSADSQTTDLVSSALDRSLVSLTCTDLSRKPPIISMCLLDICETALRSVGAGDQKEKSATVLLQLLQTPQVQRPSVLAPGHELFLIKLTTLTLRVRPQSLTYLLEQDATNDGDVSQGTVRCVLQTYLTFACDHCALYDGNVKAVVLDHLIKLIVRSLSRDPSLASYLTSCHCLVQSSAALSAIAAASRSLYAALIRLVRQSSTEGRPKSPIVAACVLLQAYLEGWVYSQVACHQPHIKPPAVQQNSAFCINSSEALGKNFMTISSAEREPSTKDNAFLENVVPTEQTGEQNEDSSSEKSPIYCPGNGDCISVELVETLCDWLMPKECSSLSLIAARSTGFILPQLWRSSVLSSDDMFTCIRLTFSLWKRLSDVDSEVRVEAARCLCKCISNLGESTLAEKVPKDLDIHSNILVTVILNRILSRFGRTDAEHIIEEGLLDCSDKLEELLAHGSGSISQFEAEDDNIYAEIPLQTMLISSALDQAGHSDLVPRPVHENILRKLSLRRQCLLMDHLSGLPYHSVCSNQTVSGATSPDQRKELSITTRSTPSTSNLIRFPTAALIPITPDCFL